MYMTGWHAYTINTSVVGSAAENCTCTDWVQAYFGECVYTTTGFWGFGIGLASVVFFFLALLPQILENIRRQDASALSGIMILFWIVGDSANITGTVMTREMGVQLYIGCCYVVMDVVLLLQFIYFSVKSRLKERKLRQIASTVSDYPVPRPVPSSTRQHRILYHNSINSPTSAAIASRQLFLTPKRSPLLQSHITANAAPKQSPKFGYEYYGGAKPTTPEHRPTRHQETKSHITTASVITEDSEILSAYDTDTEPTLTSPFRPQERVDEGSFRNSRFFAVLFLGLIGVGWLVYTPASVQHVRIGRSLLSDIDPDDPSWSLHGWVEITGYVIGCFAAVCYLVSRIPQIVKNWQRRSTEGLSIAMFILSMLANVFFVISVFLISSHESFVLSHLPWLVGAIGTVAFDIYVYFFQILTI